ncbi:hypothetical protein B0H11DRAFT_1923088 [Mycena galericulata]|nr:hypothetical protein B0H11DRAFT_1923088 [Mycena galericulata]
MWLSQCLRTGASTLGRHARAGDSYPLARQTFSHSATARARRTIQEIRQSRSALPPDYKKPTPEELQKMLIRESDRAFGPDIVGDPTAYVNQLADDVWKNILKASGNDPRVLDAWRTFLQSSSDRGYWTITHFATGEEIKTRAARQVFGPTIVQYTNSVGSLQSNTTFLQLEFKP